MCTFVRIHTHVCVCGICVNQVMANPERLSRTAERVVEEFCWVQWDRHTQRLYYLTHTAAHAQVGIVFTPGGLEGTEGHVTKTHVFSQAKFVLRCVQFYLSQMCETTVSPSPAITAPAGRRYRHILSRRTVTPSQ